MKIEEVIQALREGETIYTIEEKDLNLCKECPDTFKIKEFASIFSKKDSYLEMDIITLLSNDWYIEEEGVLE